MNPGEVLEHYLECSPLPTLLLADATRESIAVPVLSNLALAQLTHSKPLLDCLSPASFTTLQGWLAATTGNSNADDDLSLDLQLGSRDEGTARNMSVVWRKCVVPSNGGYILTALTFPPKRLSRIGMAALDSPASLLTVKAPGARPQLSTEERLAEYEMLTECSAVGLARLDLEGRCLWVNKSWLEITDHDPDVPIEEWSRCLDAQSYKELIIEFKERARQRLLPIVRRFGLKSGKVVMAHATPNARVAEMVTGWIANVTAQVKAEEALSQLALEKERAKRQEEAVEAAEQRRRDAEEQRRQQELLIDVTSHEIRNPISAILQNSELTRASLIHLQQLLSILPPSDDIPDLACVLKELVEDIEATESITECALAQERICNDILGLAQIGAKRYAITPVPFNLVGGLRKTLGMFKTECKNKAIELVLEQGDTLERMGEGTTVEADPVRLNQVITNLVSNAVRFTAGREKRKVTLWVDVCEGPLPAEGDELVPPSKRRRIESKGSPTEVIEVTPIEDEKEKDQMLGLYFAVIDTGPGMTPEQTKIVFGRFMQASALTHVEMGGSGLGLWIARSLCELHGGRIEVLSTEGVGSTFRGFVVAGSTPPDHLSPLISSLSPILSDPLRILVVDDNQINRTILVRQLKKFNHCIVEAKNGKEAVELVDKAYGEDHPPFDCVLMDVEMPVMNGLQAAQTLRETEHKSGRDRVRIVGCTGNARDGQVSAALESGMDEVITKPYSSRTNFLPKMTAEIDILPLPHSDVELPSKIRDSFQQGVASGALFLWASVADQVCTEPDVPLRHLIHECPAIAAKPAPRATTPELEHEPKKDIFAGSWAEGEFICKLEEGYDVVSNLHALAEEHIMVVPKFQPGQFRPQASDLTPNDLHAAYRLVMAYEAAGRDLLCFFNSGALSGASQPHLHMQFCPYQRIPPAPEELACSLPPQWTPARLPLPYLHLYCGLPYFSPSSTRLEVATGLHNTFQGLLELRDAKLATLPESELAPAGTKRNSYNLFITSKHMHLIPRTNRMANITRKQSIGQRDGADTLLMSINGLPLAGYWHVGTKEELEDTKAYGFSRLLVESCYRSELFN